MNSIHLSDKLNRNSVVTLQAGSKQRSIIYRLPDGSSAENRAFLKNTTQTALSLLLKKYGTPEEFGMALINEDPEVDLENEGRMLESMKSVWLTEDLNLIYRVDMIEVVYNPDGTEKSRSELKETVSNINTEIPIRCTGRMFPRKDAVRKFVFSKKYIITHQDGLTYDFLYQMAKELHDADSLMFAGGGKSGTEPIVLMDGGTPYRGFLEGRIQGQSYALILHLTNLELKEFE